MENTRVKISLGIILLLVVLSISSVFADVNRIFTLTASYDDSTIVDGETYEAVAGRKITITVNPTYVDSTLQIGHVWGDEGLKIDSNGTKTATITVPQGAPGSKVLVQFEAIIKDKTHSYVGNSNVVKCYFQYPEIATTVDVNVYNGSTKLTPDTPYEIKPGTKLKITVTTNKTFKALRYLWEGGEYQDSTTNNLEIAVPNMAEGAQKTLKVRGAANDNTTSSLKNYIIKAPVTTVVTPKPEPEPQEQPKVESLNVTVAKDGNVVRATAQITNGTFKKIAYHWDNNTTQETTANPLVIALPTSVGNHVLYVTAYTASGLEKSATYKYTVQPTTTPDEPVVEEDDELIIEDWMKENTSLDGLAVSLRNDSNKYEKSNKNIYELNEEVVYYVDYKNGEKEINKEVKLVLSLPLEYKVVDAFGGKVDLDNRTITWTFDGLAKDQAGTKIVKVKYTALSKSSLKSEVIYPSASIYVAGSKTARDTSAVINLIFKSIKTVLQDEHLPYMYGDLEAPTFRPDDSITRAEGALVLARIFGINYSGTKVDGNEFSDIGETYMEAQKAIVASTKIGLIAGFPDGTYRPNEKMTKAQFMKIIASYIEVKAEENEVSGLKVKELDNCIKVYKDSTTVYMVGKETTKTHWAIPYITLLARINMTPVSNTHKNLGLDEEITRAEVAQLVNFYLLRAPAEEGKVEFEDVSKKHKLYADILEATMPAHSYTLTNKGTEVRVED